MPSQEELQDITGSYRPTPLLSERQRLKLQITIDTLSRELARLRTILRDDDKARVYAKGESR